MLKNKEEIDNYEAKYNYLTSIGWTTYYHSDNWIRNEWFNNPNINIDHCGLSTDDAIKCIDLRFFKSTFKYFSDKKYELLQDINTDICIKSGTILFENQWKEILKIDANEPFIDKGSVYETFFKNVKL